MSHYTVLVIGKNPEEQLAPFNENTESLSRDILTFHDEEDVYIKNYNEGSSEMVRLKDGNLIYKFGTESFDTEGSTIVSVPHKVRYPTFDEYCEEYCGGTRDPEKNRYGYWCNDNAKWDWYSLGGRWTGFFKYKKLTDWTLGTPGVFRNNAKIGYCDQLFKKDIDFEGMEDDVHKEAEIEFNKVASVVNGREFPTWKEVRSKYSEEDINDARKEYSNHTVIKDLEEAGFSMMFDELKDVYCGMDKEKYIEQKVKSCITTFAVLKDGQWYERGTMGWWGIVSDEKDKNEWSSQCTKLIDELPDDTLLSLYDCHI